MRCDTRNTSKLSGEWQAGHHNLLGRVLDVKVTKQRKMAIKIDKRRKRRRTKLITSSQKDLYCDFQRCMLNVYINLFCKISSLLNASARWASWRNETLARQFF